MSRSRLQVAAALRAVAVTSPTSFAWFGVRSRPLPRAVAAGLDREAARRLLVDGLQEALYRCFYTQGRPVPAGLDGASGRADRAFVAALSHANAGSGGPAGSRRPKESIDGWPGFYMAFGDREPDGGAAGIEERVYFNVDAPAAVRLVAGCTRILNAEGIPFALKVVSDPAAAARCDAAVLYLERGGIRRARDPLRAIVAACGTHLAGEVPALTLPLARGLSVAEHAPALGASFGSSRCRLLAEAIADAHERGMTRPADRIDAVARRFAGRGLELDAPYLAPGSAERYAL